MSTTDQPHRPAPIDTTERTALLDVIRGFALGGVFLSNVYIWMSGMIFTPRERVMGALSSTLCKVLDGLYNFFVAGKCMTIFTFLFGMGLAVQFARAKDRGDSVSRRYVRRSLIMVILGVLHLALLWYGDITHQYALIGLVALLFWNRSTKTLVIWGLLLTLFAVPLGMWSQFLLPKLLSAPEIAKEAMEAKMAQGAEFDRVTFEAFAHGSYATVVRTNLVMYKHQSLSVIIASYHVGTLGNFLLGIAVGRLGWFHDVPAHRRVFRRLLGWSLLTGILSVAMLVGLRYLLGNKGPVQDSIVLSAVAPILRNLVTLGFAAAYMAAIALLYQRNFFRRIFSTLAPAGRMAMTNYFAQSAIGIFVFYGVGLGHLGDLRPRWIIVMPVVMYIVQMVCSWLWLRFFRFGPVEWMTRSFTYGKMQPMRHVSAASTEVAS